MMFEKTNPMTGSPATPAEGLTSEERAQLRAAVARGGEGERIAQRPARRAGDALRAVEWSELTARLNAARDLRILLRSESQPPIEAVGASFGDAAASYFALLDTDGQPGVNPDGLGQSKPWGAKVGPNDTDGPAATPGPRTGAGKADAREVR
jgi:hypothetical protein